MTDRYPSGHWFLSENLTDPSPPTAGDHLSSPIILSGHQGDTEFQPDSQATTSPLPEGTGAWRDVLPPANAFRDLESANSPDTDYMEPTLPLRRVGDRRRGRMSAVGDSLGGLAAGGFRPQSIGTKGGRTHRRPRTGWPGMTDNDVTTSYDQQGEQQ